MANGDTPRKGPEGPVEIKTAEIRDRLSGTFKPFETSSVSEFSEKVEDLKSLSQEALEERLGIIHRIIQGKETSQDKSSIKKIYREKGGWKQDGKWNVPALKVLLEHGQSVQKEKGWRVTPGSSETEAVETESDFKILPFLEHQVQFPLNDSEKMQDVLGLMMDYINAASHFGPENDDEFNAIVQFAEQAYPGNEDITGVLNVINQLIDSRFPPVKDDTPVPESVPKPGDLKSKEKTPPEKTDPKNPKPKEGKEENEVESSRPVDFERVRNEYLKLKPGTDQYRRFMQDFEAMAEGGDAHGKRKRFPEWNDKHFQLIVNFDRRLGYLEKEKNKRSANYPQRLEELRRLANTTYNDLSDEDKGMVDRFYPGCEKADYEAFLKVLEGGKETASEGGKDGRIVELERQLAELTKTVQELTHPEAIKKREEEKRREAQEKEAAENAKIRQLEAELRAELLENIVEECGDRKEAAKKRLKDLNEILNYSGTDRRLQQLQRYAADFLHHSLPEALLKRKITGEKRTSEETAKTLAAIRTGIPILEMKEAAGRMADLLLNEGEKTIGLAMKGYIQEFAQKTGQAMESLGAPAEPVKTEASSGSVPSAPSPSATGTPEKTEASDYENLLKIPGIEADAELSAKLRDLLTALKADLTSKPRNLQRAKGVLSRNLGEILEIKSEQEKIIRIRELVNTEYARLFIDQSSKS